ncbi:MAG: (d)CMP kinase [Oligoflexia bacterium]|nr:(d)CMP kinase [Oligoflexia bacterium]
MEKIITVDGLASSGKSTLSQNLSKKLGWPWFSTGVLYRGMAYVGLKENFTEKEYLSFFKSQDWSIQLTDLKSLFFYRGKDISPQLYQPAIDEKASLFSSHPPYRKALISVQRAFYKPHSEKGLVLEGRDCGTVLFPSAPLKIFLTAPDDRRAKRRARDRKETAQVILQSQKSRDQRDQERSFAPAVPPEDALCLDSGKYTASQLVDIVYQKAQTTFLL